MSECLAYSTVFLVNLSQASPSFPPPPSSSSPSPRYKWGSITHQSVGVVRTLNRNGLDMTVDFPEQANWTGLMSEMELVPGTHPRHM